jgi:hypothetical protein
MSLVGKYYNAGTKETLYIDTSDDETGTFSGRITPDHRDPIPVTGHYGFQTPDMTFILFNAMTLNFYECWTGWGNRKGDYPGLDLLGVRVYLNPNGAPQVVPLSGSWTR